MAAAQGGNAPGGAAGGADGIRRALAGAAAFDPDAAGDGGDMDFDLAEIGANDLANARRLIRRHGDDLLYVREIGWHGWTGSHWRADGGEEAAKRAAHDTADAIFSEVEAMQRAGKRETESRADFEERCTKLFKWAVVSGNAQRLNAMVTEARPYLTVAPEVMDSDPLVLNLANGTLRLADSCETLLPHRRSDRLAKVMDVEYDPTATCPEFDRFLARVQPNQAVRSFLQRYAGYSLTGLTSEQCLLFLYGTGSNGKSVYVNALARILGPYAVSLPFSSLVKDDRKRGSEATPDLARLPGARLVRASEPEHGARLAEATIKQITGEEEVTVRHLNQGFFDFVPQFKVMISGNHKPVIKGQDHGIWRRVRLVPWQVTIPREEWDLALPGKLWAERSGILNWMLDGCRWWLEQGLQVPDEVRAATDEYRAESDPVGRFVLECVRAAPGSDVTASAMYAAYCAWCRANAERPWSMTAFGKALPERGVRREDSRVRKYIDVELVNVPQGSGAPPPPDSEGDYD